MATRASRIDSQETTSPNVQTKPDKAAIAARAYQLWQQRGCPVGSDQDDWFMAERELEERMGQGTLAA